jgi:hypothetical protein
MNDLRSIIDKFVSDVQQYLKSQVESEVQETLRTAMSLRQIPPSKRDKVSRGKRTCRVDGCVEPSSGPRYHNMCREHARKHNEGSK